MKYTDLDAFERQYLVTALWSSTDNDGDPLDDDYSFSDFAESELEKFRADCKRFRELAGDMLDEHAEVTDAAHDFWLTRNHHGAGFWDGDWPVNGDALTKICRQFPEVTLYVGDDGKVYS